MQMLILVIDNETGVTPKGEGFVGAEVSLLTSEINSEGVRRIIHCRHRTSAQRPSTERVKNWCGDRA